MTKLIQVVNCEVCDGGLMAPVMDLGPQPLPDDLVKVGDKRECELFPTDVLWCDTCKTAQQHYVIPKKQLFPPEYHYRGANTKDVLDGFEGLAKSVERYLPVDKLKVLDVGCNDGSLLDAFYRRGALTYGIEPTDAASEAACKGHRVNHVYLDPESAANFVKEWGHPDIITFVNVFAHIEDFGALLKALSLLRKPATKIVIENHYMGSVLDRNQFDTFYHEHIRTYSFTSLEMIAERLGMHIGHCEFPSRYGGNIRVIMEPGALRYKWDLQILAYESDFGYRLEKLHDKVQVWKDRKREQLMAIAPLPAIAMPGRASILFNLLDLDVENLTGVYEVPRSKKIGYYVPGTRIPILSDAEFPVPMYQGPAMNMAWHIPKEIETRWRGLGFRGEIIQAIDPSDFN